MGPKRHAASRSSGLRSPFRGHMEMIIPSNTPGSGIRAHATKLTATAPTLVFGLRNGSLGSRAIG